MTARGSMIHIAYLKRALNIAAEEYISEFKVPTDEEVSVLVAKWIREARRACKTKVARQTAKQVRGAKQPAKKIPRSQHMTPVQTFMAATEDANPLQDGRL